MNKYLSGLFNSKASDYSLWKAAKSSKSPQIQLPPIQMPNSQWIKSNLQKAEMFALHLKEIFTPHESYEQSHLLFVEQQQNDEPIVLFSSYEVQCFIEELKLKKSPGFELITAEVFRQIPPNILLALTNVLNACISYCYIPSA